MAPSTFVILSGMLTYGTPLALAVYEIWSLRRPTPRRDDREPPAPELPRGPKPLPECLLPKPLLLRVRTRELEDA